MSRTVSIEILGRDGLKVRAVFTGHFDDVTQAVADAATRLLTQEKDAPFLLSDYESWDEEAR